MHSILIADEDPIQRRMLQQLPGRDGAYSLLEANDFVGCITAVANEKPDIVLMDSDFCQNGFTICSRLKALDENTVIVMLVANHPASISAAFDAGASDVLLKPVHPLLALRCVENLLARSSQADGRAYPNAREELARVA